MEEITYHLATGVDIDSLVSNRIRFAVELAGEQPDSVIQPMRLQLTQFFKEATFNGTCISVLAKSDAKIVGIGSMVIRKQPGNFKNPSGIWGYIMNMYTIPEFRRRGICKTVLTLLLDEGQKKGIIAYELHATKKGEPVYVQNGFKIHDEPTLRKIYKPLAS